MNRTTESPITEGSTIAVMLHNFMVRGGLTETQVAELVGADQAQVGRWRRGKTTPRAANLSALAELMGVDAGTIQAARAESERVRVEVADRKKASPEADYAKIAGELKSATARIKRLERQLRESLGDR
jgi:transcriptional regulator with XRE-family HTH domain